MERMSIRRIIITAAIITALALTSLTGCESGCTENSPTSPDRQTDS